MKESFVSFGELRVECVKDLKRIESNLRIKGDYWRADEVRKFQREVFGEESE